MEKDELNYKIDKINELLSDKIKLNEYIDGICDSNIDIPNKLNEKIINKVNNHRSCKKFKYIDVLKIAVFTVFTLVIWNGINANPYINESLNSENVKEIKINTLAITNKITGTMNGLSEFFLVPLEIKKGDNI